MREYPHQLSGGMRQRVMIAMALACNPKLLIADEPTTALDVTIQAQILDLMRDLKRRVGAAIILITHDLGVVAEVAERVMVMYAGRKVEEAPVGRAVPRPAPPLYPGLLGAVPKLGSSLQRAGDAAGRDSRPGAQPEERIPGCVFASRCPLATDFCRRGGAAAGGEGARPSSRPATTPQARRGDRRMSASPAARGHRSQEAFPVRGGFLGGTTG